MKQTENVQIDNHRKAGWIVGKLILVILDILSVNLAYFCALFLRFYINNQFRPVADLYLPTFWAFTPIYTGICLIVFSLFKLYSSKWQYAGINDFNRILLANLVTASVQVAATLIFYTRMPITYYVLGAVIQLALTAFIRFAYRLIMLEKMYLTPKTGTAVNVMIVGVGETAGIVRRQIETNQENAAKLVCIFSHRNADAHGMMDGVPVVGNLDKLKEHVEKYHVECVILADSLMPAETREKIKATCKEANVDVQDFSGYFQNEGGSFSLKHLLEYARGPVTLVTDGKTATYENGEQALMAQTGKAAVRMVSAKDNHLVIELSSKPIILNDVNQEWVKDVEKETGEEISFF